ncbi:hypothetical protein OCK74_03525 [Chitinophagaceae bacterium LB-8]|uniref:Outer membrane protein beta-barrel domain-containing protein n=1 Tax=Paraflavisolibacter caeni TaxID=2982496 RepID=A0A9X3B6K2_9BACT|nr:hypothetical protein [Paraflavisolibacter caeni]MCU7548165.1 hypothetical protein [Paraflavisolibacter caeni]
MRKYVLTLCLLFTLSYAFAQKDLLKGIHQFTQSTELKEADPLGNEKKDKDANVIKKTVERGWEFTIDRITKDGDYVISFLEWRSNDTLNKEYVVENERSKYFILPKAEYELSAQKWEKKGGFTVGAATTLVKIRPGSGDDLKKGGYRVPFDFDNDFNLGLLFGWKHQQTFEPNEIAHNFLAGFGITSIGVDSTTTQGYVKVKSNQSALTLSLGYLFEYNKFQIGAFAGYDLVAGEVGRQWIYRNRPWIGINLGFSIFKAQGTKEKQDN